MVSLPTAFSIPYLPTRGNLSFKLKEEQVFLVIYILYLYHLRVTEQNYPYWHVPQQISQSAYNYIKGTQGFLY